MLLNSEELTLEFFLQSTYDTLCKMRFTQYGL